MHRPIVHNYSTYTLSDGDYEALSFGLDIHIPVQVNKNDIYIEFQVFFQSLPKDISKIPENELRQIKTSLRNTCDKYTEIKVPYKYRKFVKELLERNPTKTAERKLQNVLQEIVSKFSSNEYKQLYPTNSSPRKFYGTVKSYQLFQNGCVEKPPIRPIISNIDTAT